LTMVLHDEENQECLAERRMNLLEPVPAMPTLKDMHKIVAKSPRTQARLFLVMEQFVITELLCIQHAYIGTFPIESPEMPGHMIRDCEDHMASSCEPGLADFAESLLSPLEAQGRGFSHAHKKVIGVPRESAAKMKRLFAVGDSELQSLMQQMRDKVIAAISTTQYESSTLPGE
jgi:hypothetical protein